MPEQPAGAGKQGQHRDPRIDQPGAGTRFLNLHLPLGMVGRRNIDFLPPHQPHTFCKAVPFARKSNDIAVVLRGIAEGPAKHEYVPGEAHFLDKCVRPDRLHQFVFGNHFFAVANEYQESIESFRSQSDRFVPAQQKLLVRLHAEGPELVYLVGVLAYAHRLGAVNSTCENHTNGRAFYHPPA